MRKVRSNRILQSMLLALTIVSAIAASCGPSGEPQPGTQTGPEFAPWTETSTGFALRAVVLGRVPPEGGTNDVMHVTYDRATRTIRGPLMTMWNSQFVGTIRMVDHTLSDAENAELLNILRALRAAPFRCSGNDGIYTYLQIGSREYPIGGYNTCSAAWQAAILDGDPLLQFLNRFAR